MLVCTSALGHVWVWMRLVDRSSSSSDVVVAESRLRLPEQTTTLRQLTDECRVRQREKIGPILETMQPALILVVAEESLKPRRLLLECLEYWSRHTTATHISIILPAVLVLRLQQDIRYGRRLWHWKEMEAVQFEMLHGDTVPGALRRLSIASSRLQWKVILGSNDTGAITTTKWSGLCEWLHETGNKRQHMVSWQDSVVDLREWLATFPKTKLPEATID